MKELSEIVPIEICTEQQQKKVLKLIGQQRKIPGLTLWEFNLSTLSVRPAVFKKVNVEVSSLNEKVNQTVRSRVEVGENCFYIQALNLKNAVKKIKKLYTQAQTEFKP